MDDFFSRPKPKPKPKSAAEQNQEAKLHARQEAIKRASRHMQTCPVCQKDGPLNCPVMQSMGK